MPIRLAFAFILVLSLMLPPVPARAEYGDVVMNKHSEANGLPPVVFPHWFHRIRFQCKVCHSELKFAMRVAKTEVLMADIGAGKFCGACHNGTIARDTEQCDLCHSGKPGLASDIIGGNRTMGPGKW